MTAKYLPLFRMEKEKAVHELILHYLQQCLTTDSEPSEELEVALDTLKSLWHIDNPSLPIPGIKSIIDLIPKPQYDTQSALKANDVGISFYQDEKFTEAIEQFSLAIKTDPTLSLSYCNRSSAYLRLEDYSNAISDCKMVISIDPKCSKAYVRYGFAEFCSNNLNDAIQIIQLGIEKCDDQAELKEYLHSLRKLDPSSQPPIMDIPMPDHPPSPELMTLMQNPEMLELLQRIVNDPTFFEQNIGDPRVNLLIRTLEANRNQTPPQ